MKQTRSAGGVVLNAQGQVLVVSQHGTSWSLPKGHVDPGESDQQAALREIEEESGLTTLTLIRSLGTYQRYKLSLDGGDDPAELKTIHMFLYRTPKTKLRPQDPDNPEARWVDPQEVGELLTHSKDKAFFVSVLPQLELDQK